MSELDTYFRFEKMLTSKERNEKLDTLLRKLYEYREKQYDEKIKQAANVLIAKLENETRILQLSNPFSEDEIEIMRRLIAARLKDKSVTFEQTKKEIEDMFKIEKTIWNQEY